MTITHRLLVAPDEGASRQLGMEAFGFPANSSGTAQSAPPQPFPWPGSHPHGMFEGKELVARLVAREYLTHFAGSQVPTCGIAGVTVKAESRGRGLLAPLFAAGFEAALERGEVISTLFPTAPRIYRRFGYELVSDYRTVEIPSAALASIPRPAGITARRAKPDDVPAIHRVYTQWAAGQHGPLTRTGPSFAADPAALIGAFDGVTVAIDNARQVLGFVSWDRGQGTGGTATIEVSDLIGLTPAATQALWSVVGSFSSVAGQIKIDSSGEDLARFPLPAIDWKVVESRPYMLALLDVAAAFAARTVTPAIATDLEFRIVRHPIESQNGCYRMNLGAGQVDCWRTSADSNRGNSSDAEILTMTPQGLALMYAGTQSCTNLRMAGMISGGDPQWDSVWDALFGGRQFHIRDYF